MVFSDGPMPVFGSYIANASVEKFGSDVYHHARRALIDYLAALLAGANAEPASNLTRALADEIGVGRCRLPANGQTALPRTAALINGTASHIVEFDDIYRDGIYHPGCPVIAAAIAACEHANATQDRLLRAIIAGYEISTRIAEVIQPAHYRFWHTTGTVGMFGAAAAVAVVLGLDRIQAQHALATAGTFAAGLQQAFRSDAMSKPLHAGRAAEGGYLAAVAAANGVTGACDILEGPAGFGAAMSVDVNWELAVRNLGETFNITRMTFKNHGCCGHSFAAIDGALCLKEMHGFGPDDIDAIRIGTYQTALDVTGNPGHASPFEGKFNLRYVVAHALLYGSVRLNAFEPDHLTHPVISRLVKQCALYCDPEAEAAFPRARAARVMLCLKSGETAEHYQPTRIGDPDAPLSDAQLGAKFIELASVAIREDGAKRLLETLWQTGGEQRVMSLDWTGRAPLQATN